jgi:capsular polysaccharide biosynthesis protein
VTDASASAYPPTTLVDYLAILRRRKWIVIVPVFVAGLGAFFLSSRQEPEYRASAVVFVDMTNLTSDPQRFFNTLAALSRSPELARQVAAELPGMTPGAVLDQTAVAASADADFLSVTATDSREAMSVRLANTFASQFTKFTAEFVRRKTVANMSSKG